MNPELDKICEKLISLLIYINPNHARKRFSMWNSARRDRTAKFLDELIARRRLAKLGANK